MRLNDRQNDMVKLLKKEGRMSVKKLADSFFVSEMTVRRDLKTMEQEEIISRYPGGAIFNADESKMPITIRKFIRRDEKKKLSANVKKYLFDSACVYIDSSSTCLYIIPILAEYKDITIVTNSVQCLLIASKYHLRCLIAGGEYFERDMCAVGQETIDFLAKLNVEVAFFSAAGFSETVISDYDEQQTAVRRAAFQNAAKKIFIFDSAKRNKKFLYTLCRTDEADDIIILEN